MSGYAQAVRLDAGEGACPLRRRRSRSRPTWARRDTFDKAMAVFAEKYADQNERDYAALKAAVDSGRVIAQPGL